MAKSTENTAQDEVAAKLGDLTFRLLAGCQEKETRLARQFKLSPSEFRVLRTFKGEKHLHIKELVERIKLSGSRLTRILDGLEKRGFLRRAIDLQDRRSIIVSLTEKGLLISRRLEERFIQIHQEILEDVPKEMHEPMMKSLSNMLSSIERWLRES